MKRSSLWRKKEEASQKEGTPYITFLTQENVCSQNKSKLGQSVGRMGMAGLDEV